MREGLRWLLVLAYLVTGAIHFRWPGIFLPIMPDWVPWPHGVILATGACEIAGAIALATRRLRWVAGVMLALYAVCVYPANIKHAFEPVALSAVRLGWWYHAPRLALQPVIVWWALYAGQVVDWPSHRQPKR
jgi:uncharacterized membrane protein